MKLPRSLRSGKRNGAERSFRFQGWNQAPLPGGQDVVWICQRIPKPDDTLPGCREGVAGHLPLEWVAAYEILEAEGERTVVKDTEAYLWITKVTRDMIDKGQVFLNNENLSTSDSSNSLVKTMDYTERSEIIDTANYLVPKPDDTSSN